MDSVGVLFIDFWGFIEGIKDWKCKHFTIQVDSKIMMKNVESQIWKLKKAIEKWPKNVFWKIQWNSFLFSASFQLEFNPRSLERD